MKSNSNRILGAIVILQLGFAGLALATENFLFKSGSAGFGAIAILALAASAKWRKKELWYALVAFAFSIGGDYFLSHRNGELMMFIYGISLFFIAHLGYLGYALYNGRLSRKGTLFITVGYLVFFFAGLYPGIPDTILLWAALAYLLVSCISMGAALGITSDLPGKQWYVGGIALIVFSDTLIALREFMQVLQGDFLVLPTYYLAHIAVTIAVWKNVQYQSK
ncbi:MAG: hypothetical protein RLZZ241_118 [Bacteroidota bacterium]|jgi:uncharacterized membrane protein YhhN